MNAKTKLQFILQHYSTYYDIKHASVILCHMHRVNLLFSTPQSLINHIEDSV